jgi:two-component system, cell cycle sensor histidine kinase and response regulator CckA
MVLVVGDAAEQRPVSEQLAAEGFGVVHASSAVEALQVLARGEIDAVVIDLPPAGSPAIEAIRGIKEDERMLDTPVIVVSRCAESGARSSAWSAGADEIFTHPLDAAELAARLRSLLGTRAAQRTLRAENRALDQALTKERERVSYYERFTRDALDALSAHIAILDRHGTIVSVNAAWRRFMREQSRDFELGQPYRADQIADTADAQRLDDAVRAVVAGERDQLVVDYQLGPADAPRWFTARATRFMDRELGHIVVSHEDVTVEKRARGKLDAATLELQESRQQVLHAQKMESVGRLAGGVAHDFNNLLTSIICFTRFVVDDMAPEDPRRSDLVEVLRAADSAARLTNQLLAFSRRKPLQTVVLDLNAALTSVGRVLRRTLGERIELVILPAEESLCVMCDAGQFDQLIFNLAVNAKDAMPDGGAITFKLGRTACDGSEGLDAGDYVELLVSDTGKPLTAEAATRAFEPFFTSNGDRTTGLGLATCYGIVQQAAGSIKVHSAATGGTHFRVLLPRVEEVRRHEHQRAAAQVPVSLRGTALVVEDQPAILRTMARALSSTGLTVLEAANGEDAVALLAARRCVPELLVTDMVLPGMSGQRLVELLRESNPGLKVVLVSGYVGDELEHDVRTDEITGFVAKPFTGRQLTTRAAALFASRVAHSARAGVR